MQSCQKLQQRRLSRAVRADDARECPALDAEGHPVEQGSAAVADGYAANVDHARRLMRTTNPIVPAILTTRAVSRLASANNVPLVHSIGTPTCAANSSPTARAFMRQANA